jgi:hypothetical protein
VHSNRASQPQNRTCDFLKSRKISLCSPTLAAKRLKRIGEPGWDRTIDTVIKSAAAFQQFQILTSRPRAPSVPKVAQSRPLFYYPLSALKTQPANPGGKQLPHKILIQVAIVAASLAQSVSASRAETLDELSRRFQIPIPKPSFDRAPQKFVVGGQAYEIPRNYILAVADTKTGVVGAITMRALLPELSGITRQTAHCFDDLRRPCHSEVVGVGISEGPFPTTGAQRLQNVRGFTHPDRKPGPCGLEFVADITPPTGSNAGFNYFIREVGQDISVIRCPKEGSNYSPRCNSSDNIGDGNYTYYHFHRDRLCQWPEITNKILRLIATFRQGVANQ